MGVSAVCHAKLTVIHVLVHFLEFAASQANVVVERFGRGVKLIADIANFVVGVEVAHGESLG